ncbi:MAG: glycogen synthase GlgA [Candidatus Saelkia tenebricola]|nr:glycogen synthase GlgA [Candidatus Saelkia tenebricola]
MTKKLKILFVSSEVVPYAKTGGLADVAGALPLALNTLGVDVRIALPKYRGITVEANEDSLGGKVPVYFIENSNYYDREYLYSTPEGDYLDNLERFVFFSQEVLKRTKKENFKPDIIHCNDWQTALIPVYLKTIYSNDEFFKNTKIIFTIHNLAYQGLFEQKEWSKIGLPKELCNIDGLEYYGKINLMKGGLIFSDFITTVSPNYIKEIQTEEYGFGMEGILNSRTDVLKGIINGIDYEIWNPDKDSKIPQNYNIKTLDKKTTNKQHLQTETNMSIGRDIPLIGAIGRLTDQKGWDLIAEVIDEICQKDLQMIILGTGEKKYHKLMDKIAAKYPLKTSINLKFDATLAQKIYAASDMFLMPSKFEPCGLGQLISYRYGSVPVARATGGLKDTITDLTEDPVHGTGFLFQEYTSQELLKTIERALESYKNRRIWRNLQKRIIKANYSWQYSAKEYLKLYHNVTKTLQNPVNVR